MSVNVSERLRPSAGVPDVQGTLGALRRRWLLMAVVSLLCMVLAIALHERAGKSYTATASVAFQNATLPDAALQVATGGGSEPQRTADTEVLIAHSSEVAEGVRGQLHLNESAGDLLKRVSVEAAPNAEVLNISASTSNAHYSAQLANAFAHQYIAFKAAAQLSSIESAEGRLAQQIAALPLRSPARAALEQSQQRLSGLRAVAGGGANIIGLAAVPNSPSGIGLFATAVIGLVIGLALAFSLVFLLELLDRRVKSIEEFEREYRLSALTAVPQTAFEPSRAEERTESLEPYRILRSGLDFVAVTRNFQTLLITSAVSGEGKTTVAIDLARAVALTGRRVVLAELDLRRPTFAQHFDIESRDGLTTSITRGGSAADAFVRPFAGLPNLSVVPAGPLPPNPSELLGSDAITAILGELVSEGGLVVIDAPPLNPVSDAQVLLNNPMIHAVLIVARVNATNREEVRRARLILDRHTVVPVGMAITGLRDARRYGYEPYEPAEPELPLAPVREFSAGRSAGRSGERQDAAPGQPSSLR